MLDDRSTHANKIQCLPKRVHRVVWKMTSLKEEMTDREIRSVMETYGMRATGGWAPVREVRNGFTRKRQIILRPKE
jgi:hypothetical protein